MRSCAFTLTTFCVLTSIWSFKVTLSRSFIMYDLKENSVKNTLCTELHPSAYASWKRKGIQWGLNTNPLFLFLPFGSYIMRQRYINFSISQTFQKNYSIVALSYAERITSTSECEVICTIKSSVTLLSCQRSQGISMKGFWQRFLHSGTVYSQVKYPIRKTADITDRRVKMNCVIRKYVVFADGMSQKADQALWRPHF